MKASTHRRLGFLAFVLGLVLTTAAPADTLRKLNGDIHVRAGETAEAVKTVNGDIRIDTGADIGIARTVNGDITLGKDTRVRALKAVNGDITVHDDVQVAADVVTVNGDIHLDHGVHVQGHVHNVRGDIRLDGARVGAGLETVVGDITVGAGSQVDGGITVKKSHSDRSDDADAHVPRIVIGPHAVVNGTLDFERKVRLHVSDSAKVGTIRGATAQTFSGDTPKG